MTNSDVSVWAAFTKDLSPLECFALIGLLEHSKANSPYREDWMNPAPPYPITRSIEVDVSRIVGEQKCRVAKNWCAARFRDILRAYCSAKATISGQASVIALSAIAPLVASATHVEAGIAVAVCDGLLKLGVDTWCSRFATKKYSGHGFYEIEEMREFSSAEARSFDGTFSVDEHPAITEVVDDKTKYPLPALTVKIVVPREVNGQFLAITPSDVSIILQRGPRDELFHRARFTDTMSNSAVEFDIKAVAPGPTRIVTFH
jgi:hypothetical protein